MFTQKNMAHKDSIILQKIMKVQCLTFFVEEGLLLLKGQQSKEKSNKTKRRKQKEYNNKTKEKRRATRQDDKANEARQRERDRKGVVVLKRYLNGMSVREIVEDTGIKKSSCYNIIKNIKALM